MTRPLRIEYPGAHYRVTSRGNERKAIFRDDTDREKFLLTKQFKPFQPFDTAPKGLLRTDGRLHALRSSPKALAAVQKFNVNTAHIVEVRVGLSFLANL